MAVLLPKARQARNPSAVLQARMKEIEGLCLAEAGEQNARIGMIGIVVYIEHWFFMMTGPGCKLVMVEPWILSLFLVRTYKIRILNVLTSGSF